MADEQPKVEQTTEPTVSMKQPKVNNQNKRPRPQ